MSSAELYTGHCRYHGASPRYRSNRKCVACATKPVRYVVFDNGIMASYHDTLEDAQRYGKDIWLARKL